MAKERSGVALGTHSSETAESPTDGPSPDEWAHEITDGDDVAALDAPPEDRFGDAVLMYHEMLARFAFMLSGSEEIAEAAVAETYARLWPKFKRGRIRSVLPHLIREVIVELEERTRPALRHPDAEPQVPESPWAALLDLPLEQRSALVLHVVEDFSISESATLLGAPETVTSARIDTGLAEITKLLAVGANDA